MNKQIAGLLMGIAMAVSMAMPFVAAAPVQIGLSYSKDSDGLDSYSYSIGTEKEEKPLNFTVYQNRLVQSNTSINENMLLGKWVKTVSKKANVTLWTGFLKNDIRDFISYSGMYDTEVRGDDHMWFSYGHDAVGTVLAHQNGISTNTTTFSYLHKPVEDVEMILKVEHTAYSDNNNQKKLDISIAKHFSERLKLGVAYGYNSADYSASPVYYVPVQESTLSIVPQLAIPIGLGKVVLTGEKSLVADNSSGSISRYSIATDVIFGNLSMGTKYFSEPAYSSRTWHMNWNHEW
ncbi:MAG: hypothetical protein H6Q68_933 [Firmicutes bacterium]|nr:hypothetical protein [Bacillota bacterium]